MSWSFEARPASARPPCCTTSCPRQPIFVPSRSVARNRRWSSPTPACSSCALHCSVASTRLPDPQKNALRVALGLREGAAPDRLLVGLAVLTLLGEAAAERPTICIVDDAQWVDRASLQALTFAARRLLADPVVMIFAARTRSADQELDGLPELNLGRLADVRRPRTALRGACRARWTRPSARTSSPRRTEIRWRCSNFTVRWHRRSWQADTDWRPRSRSRAGSSETYDQRLRELPPQTRTLLLLAAAEPTGEPAWLWAAAARLEIGSGSKRSGGAERPRHRRYPLALSASAGPFGRLPQRLPTGTAAGPRRVGRCDLRARLRRAPRLAPRPRRERTR